MFSPRAPSVDYLSTSMISSSLNGTNCDSLSRRLNIYIEEYLFEATLYFSTNELKREDSESDLKFIQPLKLIYKLIRRQDTFLLSATILNCAYVTLKITSYNITGCELIRDPNLPDQIIRTGQQLNIAFLLKDLTAPSITISYCCALRKSDAPDRVHIESSVDNRMRYKTFYYVLPFTPEEVVTMRHSDLAVVNEQFSVFLSFYNRVQAIISVDASSVWSVPEVFEGWVEDEIELTLVPNRNGPWDIPEIYVTVSKKRIPVRGSRRVMCYPNSLKI